MGLRYSSPAATAGVVVRPGVAELSTLWLVRLGALKLVVRVAALKLLVLQGALKLVLYMIHSMLLYQ